MDYNLQTKISEIIAHNDASIQAIAGIAPPLKRLKNPILRKIMASRVTIGEAARMGGCRPEDFIRVLDPLGFHYTPALDEQGRSAGHEPTPEWLSTVPPHTIRTLDVRPIIDQGTDPLKVIIAEFKQVVPGGILNIINTFVPTPLIHLLEGKQADRSYVKQINEKEYHTYFLKKAEIVSPEVSIRSNILMDDDITFQEACGQFSNHLTRVIDVRHLEMPGPMQSILGELAQLPREMALYVHHKRVPVYLLEELADGGFEVRIHRLEEGNVKMLIFHRPS